MRNTPRLLLAAGILASVIFLSFAFSAPHTHEVVNTFSAPTLAATTPIVSLHDVFKKGTHTITGSIVAPNACSAVSVDAVPIQGATASTTQSILIAISIPADTGICLQQPTNTDFKVTIDAPSSLPITATVNGLNASTTAL